MRCGPNNDCGRLTAQPFRKIGPPDAIAFTDGSGSSGTPEEGSHRPSDSDRPQYPAANSGLHNARPATRLQPSAWYRHRELKRQFCHIVHGDFTPCLWNIGMRPGNLARIASNLSSRLLKLVPGPKGKPVEISTGHRLLKKLPGIKDSVVGLKVCVSVDLPPNFHSGHVPHKACAAVAGRPDQITRNVVHAVE